MHSKKIICLFLSAIFLFVCMCSMYSSAETLAENNCICAVNTQKNEEKSKELTVSLYEDKDNNFLNSIIVKEKENYEIIVMKKAIHSIRGSSTILENAFQNLKLENKISNANSKSAETENSEISIEENQTEDQDVMKKNPPITLEEVISKYEETISYDMDVTMLSGFTLEEFQILMDGISIDDETDFYSIHAETIYNLSHQYEINEIFFAGIISAESWWGCAENCIYKNNYTGMMSNGSLIAYSSVYENLEETASNLHNNYLTEGGACYNGKTIVGVSVCYCDSSWIDLVWERMQQIF